MNGSGLNFGRSFRRTISISARFITPSGSKCRNESVAHEVIERSGNFTLIQSAVAHDDIDAAFAIGTDPIERLDDCFDHSLSQIRLFFDELRGGQQGAKGNIFEFVTAVNQPFKPGFQKWLIRRRRHQRSDHATLLQGDDLARIVRDVDVVGEVRRQAMFGKDRLQQTVAGATEGDRYLRSFQIFETFDFRARYKPKRNLIKDLDENAQLFT